MKLTETRRRGLATIVSVLAVLAIIVVGTAFGIVGYVYLLKGNTQTQNTGSPTSTVTVVRNSTTVSQTGGTNTTVNPNANVQYQGPASFSGAGQSGAQITVPAGTNVSVSITVSSTAATSGLLTVNVREDIVDAPDNQIATLQHDVALGVGANTITMGSFVAKDLTPGGPFQPREYFISVAWNSNTIYNPTNPSTREWVKTVSGPGSTNAAVTYVAGSFSGAGQSGPQIVVPEFTTVGLKVTVNSNASAEGVLSVNIRKDIVFYPDASYTTLTKTVQLVVGANTFDMGTFVMADSTCGGPGCVREYFYTVSWNGNMIYNPTNPSTRENVQTGSGSTTTKALHAQVTYDFPGTFTGGGQAGDQITVPVGTSVDTKVNVQASGAGCGNLTVEVRADIVWYPDSTVKTLTLSNVCLVSGSNTVDMGSFIAAVQTGGWPGQTREYFIRVYWNGQFIYNPTNPSTREWVKTS